MTGILNENTLRRLYEALAEIPTVSGYESRGIGEIGGIAGDFTDFFTEGRVTPGGGLLLIHRTKEEAPTLLFDAHIDTVGFCITEILENGFLHVAPVGGIDRRLLFGREIELYGKKTVRGIFAANPPHLKKTEANADGLPPLEEIPVDTGYTEQELRKILSVGDPGGYVQDTFMMENHRLCGKSMDDKICACAILLAAKLLSQKDGGCPVNLVVSLSSSEEVNGSGGAYLGELHADGAVVLDVNFGRAEGVPDRVSYVLGEGCGVSYSCTTNRILTEGLIQTAKERDIPLSVMVEPKSTGTNANYLQTAGLGTPAAVLSIPELYMHAGCETVSTEDVFSCARLLCAFAEEFPAIRHRMNTGRVIKPLPLGKENRL